MRTIEGGASRVIGMIRLSVARGGDRRGTADGILRLQRTGVKRQSRHQQEGEEINRIGLRRGDCPPHQASGRCGAGIVFHAVFLRETARNWKGQLPGCQDAAFRWVHGRGAAVLDQ